MVLSQFWQLCFSFTVIYYLGGLDAIDYEGRQYVNEGDPFTITCLRTAFGAPKWTKDGSAIIPNYENNFTLTSEKLDTNMVVMQLMVHSAMWSHRGEYKCDPFNEKSHRIEIVPSTETDSILNESAGLLKINETLVLYCPDSIVTDNVFQINWYKDGHRISQAEDPRFSLIGRTLLLEYPNEEDAGEYLCVVEVSGLTYPIADHIGFSIQVTYAARVEEFPAQIRPILGRNLTLECKVFGYPVPRITWFIDNVSAGEKVLNNSRYSILDNDDGLPSAIFFIEGVMFDDISLLTCIANNMQTTVFTSVLLAVRGNMIDTNEEVPGAGIQLFPGSNLVLQCNTTDDPNLNVKWYKSGLSINMTDTRFIVENSNNTLTVEKTTEDDTGSYMCVADIKSSAIVNATINVKTKVKLMALDSSRNVVQGQKIVLVCNVTQGTPPPLLQWYKDGVPMNLSDSRMDVDDVGEKVKNGKVTIKEADYDDRAEYMCIATNDLGPVNTTMLVRVKDKYAALWPFIGICVEVAILCTIIFVYEKRRQKPEFDESEGDQATENKTVSDHEEKSHEIRQRK